MAPPSWFKRFGISGDNLLADNIQTLENCTNGLVLELYRFNNQKKLPQARFVNWLRALLPSSIPPEASVDTIWLAVTRNLHSKRDVLRRGKLKKEIKEFESKLFVFSEIHTPSCVSRLNDIPTSISECPGSQNEIPTTENESDSGDNDHKTCETSSGNLSVATSEVACETTRKNSPPQPQPKFQVRCRSCNAERNSLQYEVHKKKTHLSRIKSKITKAAAQQQKLNGKVGLYKPKNVKRREKRHQINLAQVKVENENFEKKIEDLQEESLSLRSKCRMMSGTIKSLKKKVTDEQRMKSYYKRKWETSTTDLSEIGKLKGEIKSLKEKLVEKEDCIAEDDSPQKHVALKSKTVFTVSVRICCMVLTALEVAADKVAEVIRAVGYYIFECCFSLTELPGRQSVQNIVDEAQFLVKKYYDERLKECHHYGIKKDGTTRQKRKIITTSIKLDTGENLPCDFKQVAQETAETIAKNVQNDLLEVAQCGQSNLDQEEVDTVDKDILSKMSFTMSDRAANEKASNRLLDEWRHEEVYDAEPLHHFHCMAHPLLGFHSYSVADLKKAQLEIESKEVIFGLDAESVYRRFGKQYVATRVPLLACDIIGPMGDEKNGVRDKWEAHCLENAIQSIVPNYRDNRFNALFESAAAVVHHRTELISCLSRLREAGNTNLKVKAVLMDLQDDKAMSFTCALGLTYCHLTHPYWQVVTSDKVEYLQLYPYIQKVHTTLQQWQQHPEGLLVNQDSLFEDFPMSDRPQLESCIQATVDKDILYTCIKAIANGLLRCCEKQLSDFLKDGKLGSVPNDKDLNRTSKSGATSLEVERQFGSLDASMGRRRNASLHYHSTLLMLKTSRKTFFPWLENQKDSKLWSNARMFGKSLRCRHLAQEKKEKQALGEITKEAIAKKQAKEARKIAVAVRKASAPEQKRKRQSTVTVPAATPTEEKHCLSEGTWVAVAYERNWYPGQIVGGDDELLKVNFLHHARGPNFKRPEKADIVDVEPEFVFANIEGPVPLGRRKRYKIEHFEELNEQYERFQERYW